MEEQGQDFLELSEQRGREAWDKFSDEIDKISENNASHKSRYEDLPKLKRAVTSESLYKGNRDSAARQMKWAADRALDGLYEFPAAIKFILNNIPYYRMNSYFGIRPYIYMQDKILKTLENDYLLDERYSDVMEVYPKLKALKDEELKRRAKELREQKMKKEVDALDFNGMTAAEMFTKYDSLFHEIPYNYKEVLRNKLVIPTQSDEETIKYAELLYEHIEKERGDFYKPQINELKRYLKNNEIEEDGNMELLYFTNPRKYRREIWYKENKAQFWAGIFLLMVFAAIAIFLAITLND